MKIGILTLPLHINYGGVLQAYALMTTFKKMGHEVWLIDRQQNRMPQWRYFLAIIKRVLLRYVLNKEQSIFVEKQLKEEFLISSQYTQLFVDRYISPKTTAIRSTVESSKICKYNFDVCIVGSDQVWRPEYIRGMGVYNYFFDFLNNSCTKRVAYAASFGTKRWNYTAKETEKCKKLAQKFDFISVREDSGVELCEKYWNVVATHVLDPTMLLTSEEYISLIDSDSGDVQSNGGDLMTYVLDDTIDKRSFIKDFADKYEFTPFNITIHEPQKKGENITKPTPPIESWLQGFRDAKFVITDSFHGVVFSIIFNKPFIAIGNENRGLDRFLSLLRMFDLENRLITSLVPSDCNFYNTPINWDVVNGKLQAERKKSMRAILNSLE